MTPPSMVLHIEDGIHQGAVVRLAGRETWAIGSGIGADILLVDDGIAERHATIHAAEGSETVDLTAEAEGVDLFGRALAAGTRVSLRAGSTFAVGPVSMRLSRVAEEGAKTEASGRDASAASARRHALRQLSRKAYAIELLKTPRWGRIARHAVPAALAVAVLAWLALAAGRRTAEDQARALAYIAERFPDVAVRHNEPTGVTTYTGYVEGHGELGELRTLALAADQGRSVIRVVPMEALAWNALQILEEFYAEPEVKVDGAGAIVVTLRAPGAVKTLQGWDFEGVAERLRKELPELRRVDVRMAEQAGKPVAVGWSRSPYSVVSTQSDTYFAITESGERIFDGAMSGEGVVKDIYRCGMIIDPERGKHFLFDFKKNSVPDYCGK